MLRTKILINVLVGILFFTGLAGLLLKIFTMDDYIKFVRAVAEYLIPLIIAYGLGKGAQEVVDGLKQPGKDG